MATDAKARGKGPKLPAVMSANDLREGLVVFLSPQGWTEDPREAVLAYDEETAGRMELEGQKALKANRIVDPYLVPVEVDASGAWRASHFREAIRQAGPTVHPEMGKQADYPFAGN